MKIQSKEIQIVDIQSVKPNPRNRNKHTKEQIARLCDIIKYQGFRAPLIISNRTGLMVAGHGRLEAAKKLGMKQVPVIFQDFESEEQEIAAGVSDNAIAAWSELDLEGINLDIGELGPEFDIDLLGIKGFEIDVADKEGLTDPDEIPETPKESPVCRGELFRLGSHRLLCGDSTSITDVERLMNGEKAEMTFTSPPYNLGISGKLRGNSQVSKSGSVYKNNDDNLEQNEYSDFLQSFSQNALVASRYLFTNIQTLAGNRSALWDWMFRMKDQYCDTIIWDKLHAPPQQAERVVNSCFEFVFIHTSDENPNRAIRIAPQFRGTIDAVYRQGGQKQNEFSKIHGATFPIHLPEYFISTFTNEDSSVYEPFSGSGTTLIACEKTNRRCFGMEIDPHYCSVILDRWAAFTGKDPVRLNDDGTETPWSEIKATLKSSILA